MTDSYGVNEISAPGAEERRLCPRAVPRRPAYPAGGAANRGTDRAGITGVFVVDAQGNAQFRMIRAGKIEAGRVEVLSTYSGERVVSGNAPALQNGDHIQGY